MNEELSPNTNLSHYRIIAKLGAGGMGEVYLAQDTKLDRNVALKVLPAEVASDRERMVRFGQEAKAASALNHPNIITIYEIEQVDSVHFMAIEFIDGETLRERMRKTSLKLSEVLDIATQVAGALAAAHEAGIVHRDIKPENIMLRRDGIVKVLDFGLAKLTGPQTEPVDTEAATEALFRTAPGIVVGTAAYMSPEQARGHKTDPRTDIFSLGTVIFEMVAGCLPFNGTTTSELLAAILNEKEQPPLARFARDVPLELEHIVSKALRKDREYRYQTVKDLLIDLNDLRRDLEVQAQLERRIPRDSPDLQTISPGTEPAGSVPTEEARLRRTWSGDDIVSHTKRHKRAVAAGLIAIFLLSVASLAYYFYSARSGSRAAIDSIAVLPLANASADPDAEYLSDGITESIINQLSRLPTLHVMARSTVFTYKGKEVDPRKVGRELGVGAVLTGRLARRDKRLMIAMELVSVADGIQLWGERYDRNESDLLAVQQEISREVSDRLRLRLRPEQKQQLARNYTQNGEAYQFYLKGRYFWNKFDPEGLKKSIEYYNQALDKDPNYALAYAGIADAYSVLANNFVRPRDNYPKSAAAVAKALELDPTLSEAQITKGFIEFFYEWDWAAVKRQLSFLLKSYPNDPNVHTLNSYYLRTMGRLDEALAEANRALELDPLASHLNADLVSVYITRRQYDDAIAQAHKSLDIDPNSIPVLANLAAAYDLKGDYSEAIATYTRITRLIGRAPIILGFLGHTYARSGNRDEARRLLDELSQQEKEKYVFPSSMGYIYVGLGEKDEAFKWLGKAYEERDSNLVSPGIRFDPMLEPLRSDPRYADLLRRMNLSPN